MRRDQLVLAVRAACVLFVGVSTAEACPSAVTSAGDPGASGLDLRTAIGLANASSGCAITFDPSLNNSTITLTLGQISITAPMAIIGPGADKLTISGNNASRIFYISRPAPTPTATPVTISGVSLSNGKSNKGGAVYTRYSPLVVQSSVFSGNTGGGIWAYDADALTIDSTVIAHNTGASNGGGLYASFPGGGTLTVTNSVVTGNDAVNGGGVALDSVHTATFTNTQITHNTATSGNGGGIRVADTWAKGTYLTLAQSTVGNNNAYDYGAGIDIKHAQSVTVQQSLISGNQLTDFTPGAHGGGIALEFVGGLTEIDNSTIYGNFAYNSGGGIGIFDAGTGNRTNIFETTIAHNGTFDPPYAPGTSSGILGAGGTGLFRCIIAGNSTSHGVSTQDLAGSFSATYTLIQHPGSASITGNTGNVNTDPQLGPLAVNGGPTLAMLPALTSPVIGAGGAREILGGVDQRGLPRPDRYPDMGAVQRQYPEDVIFRNGFD